MQGDGQEGTWVRSQKGGAGTGVVVEEWGTLIPPPQVRGACTQHHTRGGIPAAGAGATQLMFACLSWEERGFTEKPGGVH